MPDLGLPYVETALCRKGVALCLCAVVSSAVISANSWEHHAPASVRASCADRLLLPAAGLTCESTHVEAHAC
eukprot:1249535-Rhodomonas_salina.1